MKLGSGVLLFFVILFCVPPSPAQKPAAGGQVLSSSPKGPCDIYAAAGDPCVAAHSTTRALYAAYNGPLYQVLRQSDGRKLDIGVVQPTTSPTPDPGGYANAAAQDAFCANTYCWISVIYDQSPKHNDLTQAPRGGFSGPAMGGFNNLPLADMAPITVLGHKVYGVFVEPGMGLRMDDPKGTAVDDQAEGQYWVINGLHFNSGCCFDYGNAEIDSRDDDNGTMETAYYGDATPWYHGDLPGPWIMTDQENNLVGCVTEDGSKHCPHMPNITWRFVTAMANGEPHHWTSMGGNAQQGPLSVMFDGRRVNSSYDPMRKQGAILLGNGGDNSNGSQGTFYEGAMTAAGTFPTDATDQQVQANIVAAGYGAQRLSIAPASSPLRSPGLQTFSPGTTGETTVTFTNTTSSPVRNLSLGLSVPSREWRAVLEGSSQQTKTFSDGIGPGESVSATFTVTSGLKTWNGDLVANASWEGTEHGTRRSETAAEKIRNVAPVKINEFRIGSSANPTDSFIELYNPSANAIDLSNWTLTEHPAQQATLSTIKIPAGTMLQPKGFYLLGISNSGLAGPARVGDSTLSVRSIKGMSVGDTISVGTGSEAEIRKIASLGTEASDNTTVWQPLPDGPVITLPSGSTNVPVESVSGFKVGEKIALGYGASYPAVDRNTEQHEIATVTAVGKPGTQAYLAVDAPTGTSNIKVTSVADISVGDKIRLDIDSLHHGIETVTVTHVGTNADKTNLTADAAAGATTITVRRSEGFTIGDKISVGNPANMEIVTVAAVQAHGQNGAQIIFTPALTNKHGRDEWVVSPGTGLDLAAPLRFNHAANLPFSDRGTGITFEPATKYAHSSNEPVQALGSGMTLDNPLKKPHEINTVVRDATVTTAGYQGSQAPNQWFGGPELSTNYLLFGRTTYISQGTMVLRDASDAVVDSLNYGALVTPWAAEGYQAESGSTKGGCFVPSPGPEFGPGPLGAVDRSAGRFPDGADTDSNCTDFHTQAATTLALASIPGSTTIRVASVSGFERGQKLNIDTGLKSESGTITVVGTAGASTLGADTAVGANSFSVVSAAGFRPGQTITIDDGANTETATIQTIRRFNGFTITVASPLQHAHATGAQVSGTGITLASALTETHAVGTRVATDVPTPGAPNAFQSTSTEEKQR